MNKNVKYIPNVNIRLAGFTLIELLVVIAIIGLLASVVLVALNSSRQKSRDAKRIGDINQMAKVMELYFNDNYSYPTSAGTNASGQLDTDANLKTLLVPKYLGNLPSAPNPNDAPCGSTAAPGNNPYYWVGTGTAISPNTSYTITFCLGNKTGALGQGSHTLTPGGFQ